MAFCRGSSIRGWLFFKQQFQTWSFCSRAKGQIPNLFLSERRLNQMGACPRNFTAQLNPEYARLSNISQESFRRKGPTCVNRMAQFTTQGRLKLLFNGDGVSSRLEQKDPFHFKLRSIQTHERRLRYAGASGRLLHCSASLSGKATTRCNAEAQPTVSSEDVYEDIDSDQGDLDDEFDSDDLSCFRGLVLDIAYRGFSPEFSYIRTPCINFRPVNVVGWKRAICLEFMEKADVLEYYDQTVNSPSGSFYIPAVLRLPQLLKAVKRRIVRSNLSRKNILFRDGYTCQYCSSQENLTIDHVVPTALGGEWTWENLVAACVKCNSKKGQKTLEEAKMKLSKIPKAPKDYDILAIPLTSAALQMLAKRKGTPEEWRQYLSSPSSEP